MTKLFLEDLVLEGADIGPSNPLPPLATRPDLHEIEIDPKAPQEMKAHIGYGNRTSPLPYTLQDGYSRTKRTMAMKTAVLENEHLKATFALEYGGRLWSLFDKKRNRDLVDRNPVFQPANLAIRNAWFSGGVEWNIGLRGHSPFTCSSLFAARVENEGAPILRLYEFERMRQVPFQIDFILPDDSELLYVYVKITNPHEEEVPMYWWSNIAFPEHEKTRVIVPAEEAFRFGYGKKGLTLKPIPEIEGIDVTYSRNLGHSADFFFNTAPEQRKWISAFDQNGKGLFQTSTDRLIGRKLFVWGSGPGGNAWQEFLAAPGEAYIEIQAGLARTQMEHIPMPGGETWDWLEAYGGIDTETEVVHGDNWKAAYTIVDEAIESVLPRLEMERHFESAKASSLLKITDVLHRGAGWGQLENVYRTHIGLEPLTGEELSFSGPLEPGEEQWKKLLEEGNFPCPDLKDEPSGYEVEAKWLPLIEKYVQSNPNNWYAWLHMGLIVFQQGRVDDAADAWMKSAAAAENPWAYRNLAKLAAIQGNISESIAYYEKAYRISEYCFPLVVEFGVALVGADLASRWLEIYSELSDEAKSIGRFQLLYAQALLGTDQLEEAKSVIAAGPRVDDLREGENSLTDIWYRIHEKMAIKDGIKITDKDELRAYVEERFPPPAAIDFRMRTKPSKI
ncbi:MAG: DUF5107 domain-containing protein [Spirochaetales bacterium]|jgi:tetratricopeptide (TPR) repeat protein|nr:DUF5107 domain-containing protein [Spirochaetales bacterium]